MKKKLFKTRLLSFAAFCGLTLMFASCANEEVAQTPNNTDNDKNLTTFTAGDPTTRTSMESDGKFFWEAGDKIWVKDDNGAWQQSSNAPTEKTASFKFKVPGKFTQSSTYKVYYPGKNGNQDQVTIPATQSQSEPNATAHFGTSGDCGMADAAWSNIKNGFAFTLDHKAAYLLFLPHTSNTILNKCYLTKIEVNSDDDIASTYTLDPVTGKLTGTGTRKKIELTIGGSGIYTDGFPLVNSTTSAATNGSYVVIKPGTHTLKIRYWVKDVATETEGTITKTLSSATYDQNKYYNITANLDVKNYDGDHYYMWDAQDQYWKGYEWNQEGSQITLNRRINSDYAQNSTDSRFYSQTFISGVNNFATHVSCKDHPNANEMTWYAEKGNPNWDAFELWTTMGHLYKGGIWIKKKAVLQAEGNYSKNIAADGRDWLIHDYYRIWPVGTTLPSAAEANNYFYLPALGKYESGYLDGVGGNATFWSSTASPWANSNAYYLRFRNSNIIVDTYHRRLGARAQTFSDFGDN